MASRGCRHGQSALGGDLIGANPTDRGKHGVKRSLLVEATGGPLAVVIDGANRHDAKLLSATLNAVIVARPQPTAEKPQHLSLDKGYDNPTGHQAVAEHQYTPHIRRIGEEKFDEHKDRKYPARRWVVERTLAWLSKCRAILVRYDKKTQNYLALRRVTMHRMHNHPQSRNGPETAGFTLHWAAQYDLFGGLVLGVNRPNSRMVVEMARIKPGDKILDVGCGTGGLTLTAERYAGPSGSVYGIDASLEMIEVASKKAQRRGSKVVFDLGVIEKMPYAEATFDVVISRLVIHHLPGDLKRQAFAEILRVLKPGGSVFLADFRMPANPLLAHLASAMVGHQMMRQSDASALSPLLTEAGFVEVASGPTRSAFLAFVSGKKPS